MRGMSLDRLRAVFATSCLLLAADAASAADLAKASADILKASGEARALKPQIEARMAELNADRLSAYRDLWADGRLTKPLAELEAGLAALPKEKVPAGVPEKLAALKAEVANLGRLNERLASEWSSLWGKYQTGNRALPAHYEKLEADARRLASDASATGGVASAVKAVETAREPVTAAPQITQVGQLAQNASLTKVRKAAAELAERLAFERRLAELAAAMSDTSLAHAVAIQNQMQVITDALTVISNLSKAKHDTVKRIIASIGG